jgi:hemerythrin superfamily protein
MDAIELLTNDHNKVRQLFRDFNGGGGLTGLVRRTVGSVSTGERHKAVQQVCKELEMHTRIEEQIFYPAVTALGDRDLKKQIDEALREHATVKQEVARLKATKRDEAALDDQMSRLEKDVEHHATEEEKEMFPRLEEIMPEEKRQELARRMQALKRRGSATPRRASASKKASTRSKSALARSTASSRTKTSRRTKAKAMPKSRSTRRR